MRPREHYTLLRTVFFVCPILLLFSVQAVSGETGTPGTGETGNAAELSFVPLTPPSPARGEGENHALN